jgi:2-hydroxychromene-2-carboxylate isomerase
MSGRYRPASPLDHRGFARNRGGMTRPQLEFWFEFASTYSCPAAMRIEEGARKADIDIAWRPFLLGPLLKSQQGIADSPFNVVPEKGAYMWRDVARICAGQGLDFKKPSAFPRNGLGAARVVLANAGQDWTIEFIKSAYRANFVRDLDIGDPGMLAACVIESGGDPVTALAAAETRQTKQALRDATVEAARKGIFGAPSFVAEDGELFWGNDRLDDAIAWAVKAGRRA